MHHYEYSSLVEDTIAREVQDVSCFFSSLVHAVGDVMPFGQITNSPLILIISFLPGQYTMCREFDERVIS